MLTADRADWREAMLAQRDWWDTRSNGVPLSVEDPASAPRREAGRRRLRWQNRSPLEVMTRGEIATAERLALRCQVADAHEVVTVLREELASLARANAEPACALEQERFNYADQLRRELIAAEARLRTLRDRRQALLLEVRGLRSAAAKFGARTDDPAP